MKYTNFRGLFREQENLFFRKGDAGLPIYRGQFFTHRGDIPWPNGRLKKAIIFENNLRKIFLCEKDFLYCSVTN
jgi:hypothetical protein